MVHVSCPHLLSQLQVHVATHKTIIYNHNSHTCNMGDHIQSSPYTQLTTHDTSLCTTPTYIAPECTTQPSIVSAFPLNYDPFEKEKKPCMAFGKRHSFDGQHHCQVPYKKLMHPLPVLLQWHKNILRNKAIKSSTFLILALGTSLIQIICTKRVMLVIKSMPCLFHLHTPCHCHTTPITMFHCKVNLNILQPTTSLASNLNQNLQPITLLRAQMTQTHRKC